MTAYTQIIKREKLDELRNLLTQKFRKLGAGVFGGSNVRVDLPNGDFEFMPKDFFDSTGPILVKG